MKISDLFIRNYKSIKYLHLKNIENTLILVGKNSTGKTIIMDALMAVSGTKKIETTDFRKDKSNIEIGMTLDISEEDLAAMHEAGKISKYKRYDKWLAEFNKIFKGFANNRISFIWTMNYDGSVRFEDEYSKDNPAFLELLPKFYYLDYTRDIASIERELFMGTASRDISEATANRCIYDNKKPCNKCFQCIRQLEKKTACELDIREMSKLMEYKVEQENRTEFAAMLDENFHKNSGYTRHLETGYTYDIGEIINTHVMVTGRENAYQQCSEAMSPGMKSLYALSLLETYVETNANAPFVIMIEDPELFLHPSLQKNACEILSKLSKKNQVIFSTHSPNMIMSFAPSQIKQIYLDNENNTNAREKTDINYILADLGYSAGDLLGVGFVFFVEGKQDRSRLPLLLNKYYQDVQGKDGNLTRISIITTNSCTNIKTYANLKYINQLYIKDQFLMIRDSDGKDKSKLKESLCTYYKGRDVDDKGYLPKVTKDNVLILKYYSFENYFLDPAIMTKIGVINDENEFYDILYKKYNEYLKNSSSFKHMAELGIVLKTKEDFRKNLENIRIYGRGHNLFNIFYGRYRGNEENEILLKYIEIAPRECFADILDAVEKFSYFSNRRHG